MDNHGDESHSLDISAVNIIHDSGVLGIGVVCCPDDKQRTPIVQDTSKTLNQEKDDSVSSIKHFKVDPALEYSQEMTPSLGTTGRSTHIITGGASLPDVIRSFSGLSEETHQAWGLTQQSDVVQRSISDAKHLDPLYEEVLALISKDPGAVAVKSILDRLLRTEESCIASNRSHQQGAATVRELYGSDLKQVSGYWNSDVKLHYRLLRHYHNFFLACQDPSNSTAIHRLPTKHAMPARMWKHGIHNFLEVLRRQLPSSLESMLAFFDLAYQMTQIFYEAMPLFKTTWMECLGDLARYRMAIEDKDTRVREKWAATARLWYSKVSDMNPRIGRLYHHLAILASSDALLQISYYARSLSSAEPFHSARESITVLFDYQNGRTTSSFPPPPPMIKSFVRVHAYLFEIWKAEKEIRKLSQDMEQMRNNLPSVKFLKEEADKTKTKTREQTMIWDSRINSYICAISDESEKFLGLLDVDISSSREKWKPKGVYTALTNITAWFNYGEDLNILRQIFLLRSKEHRKVSSISASAGLQAALQHSTGSLSYLEVTESEIPTKLDNLRQNHTFSWAHQLSMATFAFVLRRTDDESVLPYVNTMLFFITTLAAIDHVCLLTRNSPWDELVPFLNALIEREDRETEDEEFLLESNLFPDHSERNDELRLPEDRLICGLIWADSCFPANWFEGDNNGNDAFRLSELASTKKSRRRRVLRLAYQLSIVSSPKSRCESVDPSDIKSKHKHYMQYDRNVRLFSVVGSLAVRTV